MAPGRGSNLRVLLLGDFFFQIGEDLFAGLDGLIYLLGVLIAHKDTEEKTNNE
jgi:hypothetical protein